MIQETWSPHSTSDSELEAAQVQIVHSNLSMQYEGTAYHTATAGAQYPGIPSL